MKSEILIALALFILLCVTPARGEGFPQPHCVVNAIYCAWTWGTFKKDPVRIAVQNISKGVDHAQAEAFMGGIWTPLTEVWIGTNMVIVPSVRHFQVEPYRYLNLSDWITEQIRYANQGDMR